ncbi:MAG: TolB family protein [Chloroflexota bacterium]
MTGFDRIQAQLPERLNDLAAPRVPDYVDDLLARSSATRQRPAWSFIERWLPMGVIARQRLAVPQVPWRTVGILVIIALIVAATAVFIGSQRRGAPPFGVAKNGLLLYEQDGDIYVRNPTTRTSQLIVGGPDDDHAAGFSHDGTKISFIRIVKGQTMFEDDTEQLLSADPDGTDLHVLTGPLVGLDTFDWSPDSTQIAFASRIDNSPTLSIVPADGSASAHPIPLGMPVYNPTWRPPDGKELVFRAWKRTPADVNSGLFAIKPDGTGLHPVSPTDGNNQSGYRSPNLSPDGRLVAYSASEPAGKDRIHLFDLATGTDRKILFGSAKSDEHGATFSPDGTRLAFKRWQNDTEQIVVAALDGSAPEILVGPPYSTLAGNGNVEGDFSPDGKSIVYVDYDHETTRIFDLAAGGDGVLQPWTKGMLAWQRVAP